MGSINALYGTFNSVKDEYRLEHCLSDRLLGVKLALGRTL